MRRERPSNNGFHAISRRQNNHVGDECGQLEKISAQVEELAISQKKTQK